MPIEVIDKIKQKNNGSFKLLDANDVEMSNGESAEKAINDRLKSTDLKTINGETIAGTGNIEVSGYDKLYGTWLLNETLTTEDVSFMFAFESNGTVFNKIDYTSIAGVDNKDLEFGGTSIVSVYTKNEGWLKPEYRKIEIYGNLPYNKEAFETWLKANAVKGGNIDSDTGGAGEVAEVEGETLVFKPASSGNDIVINSTEEATEELTNIKQGDKVYSIPQSGGGSIVGFNGTIATASNSQIVYCITSNGSSKLTGKTSYNVNNVILIVSSVKAVSYSLSNILPIYENSDNLLCVYGPTNNFAISYSVSGGGSN